MRTRVQHGTRSGFQQHKALGSMVCEPCRAANNAYMRAYMRAHYDPARRRAAYLRQKEKR